MRFEDFAGWHSRMILAELPQDGNLRFRVIGENAMGMFGVRIRKGSRFSDLPDITFSDYADYFKAIQAGATYGRHAGMVPFRGSQQSRFEVLDLPAADEEGNVAFLYSFFLYC
ncbi:hypothetical protein [Kordiimonas sp.]|uniref:hypothetical protein n=1 Tax=Kordiimonas sp. TaxID=1970157 RepID=UPI003A8D960A